MSYSYDDNLDQTGQHYVVDKELIKFIVDSANLKYTDTVLEIGYGHGELTRELIKKCIVVAVDIDGRTDIKSNRLKIINANILDEIDKIRFDKIVSNIPYNISEPLMKKLFKMNFQLAVLTIGKNFSDILTKKNNRIGIIASSLWDIEILKIVKPKSFNPMPRVDSAVVKIRPKSKLSDTESIYRELAFLDHKKIRNALEKIIKDKTKKELNALMQDKLFDKKIYELSNKEFIELDEFLKNL
jgi:16S rRNA (adenine1518-N6/adenine1519-N6)-dimethyltransferase